MVALSMAFFGAWAMVTPKIFTEAEDDFFMIVVRIWRFAVDMLAHLPTCEL